jgi:hypothetical protein
MTATTEFEQVEYGYDSRREFEVTFKGKAVGHVDLHSSSRPTSARRPDPLDRR